MEEIITAMVQNSPNLLGLLLFAVAMWRMVEKLQNALLDRVAKLETSVSILTSQVERLNSSVVLARSASTSVPIAVDRARRV